MKAIDFPEANSKLLAGSIPNCKDLPVLKDGRQIISRWKMSWSERVSALFFGVAYVSVLARDTSPAIAVWVQRRATKKIRRTITQRLKMPAFLSNCSLKRNLARNLFFVGVLVYAAVAIMILLNVTRCP